MNINYYILVTNYLFYKISEANLKKLFSIIEGNPGSLKVAMGFHNILNKYVDEIINKLESSQYKGSKLWVLFKASGGQSPKPNVPDHMCYHVNGSDTPIEMQKESLQKTWDAII